MNTRALRMLLLVIFSASFYLPGCWSRREINDLAIVAAMGFDKTRDGKIQITVEVVRPVIASRSAGGMGASGGGSKSKPYWIMEATGETIIDAARNLNLKSPRRLFFSHVQVMVFGQRLARDGLGPVMDRLSRSNEVRRNIFILVTSGQARDIIEAEPDIENIPGIGLRGLIERRTVTSKAVGVDLKDFLADLASKPKSPVATRVEIVPDNRSREIWRGQGGGSVEGSGGQDGSGTVKSVELTGTAAFHQDKLVGWLDREESIGLLWLKGRVERTITVINDPVDGKKTAIETTRSQVDVKPQLDGDKVKLVVEIRQEGDLAEHMGRGTLSTPETVKRVNRQLAAQIKKQAEKTLQKAQKKLNTDIFGFGEAVRRKYPKQWAGLEPNWHNLYRQAEVVVQVRANVRRRNLTTEPPPSPQI